MYFCQENAFEKLHVNNYCPHRILFHFPALKIVKQNEEMKQNAVKQNAVGTVRCLLDNMIEDVKKFWKKYFRR